MVIAQTVAGVAIEEDHYSFAVYQGSDGWHIFDRRTRQTVTPPLTQSRAETMVDYLEDGWDVEELLGDEPNTDEAEEAELVRVLQAMGAVYE